MDVAAIASQPASAKSNEKQRRTKSQSSSAHSPGLKLHEYCTVSEKCLEEMLTDEETPQPVLEEVWEEEVCEVPKPGSSTNEGFSQPPEQTAKASGENEHEDTSLELAQNLVGLVNVGQLTRLAFSGGEISEEFLHYVAENIQENNELKELDLSYVVLRETGITAVSKIMSKARKLEKIKFHDCELNAELLGILLQEKRAVTSPVKSLTLSSNPTIWDDVKVVVDVIGKFGCEEIDISANSLGSEHIKELANANVKVRKIHVCENPINDWKSLGNLVKNWGIRELDASECRMYREDCHEFASSLGSYQLDELNLHHVDRSKKFAEETNELLKTTAKSLSI